MTDGERLYMNDHNCPLCADTYGQRTNLQVHLEVEHRKSEIVSHLIDRIGDVGESTAENERRRVETEPPISPI